MITTTTLKNAARALGYDLWSDPDGSHYLVKDGAIFRRWEPSGSDSDAFQLSVKLGMTVDIDLSEGWTDVDFVAGFEDRSVRVSHTMDECAATRMAIVMASSEIGEGLRFEK